MGKDIKCLSNFINSFITVSTKKNVVGAKIAKTVKEVNQHKHSKTCAKYGNTCRFNYPKPPAPHTIIVQPLIESDTKKRDKLLNKYSQAIHQVITVLENKEYLEEIMKDYDLDSETKEEHEMKREDRIRK